MPKPSAPRRLPQAAPPLRIPLPRPPSGESGEPGRDRHPDTDRAPAAVEPLPHLLTVAEVCAILRRTDRTLRAWVSRGYLTPVEIGGAVFFREDAIRALIEGRVRDAVLSPAQRRRKAARERRDAEPPPDP